ncbi:MAG TPA: hypothetical protein DDY78_12680 [Planctomycetales bacterium]|jgi:hypothetical protein|nr:hypothetical protein [Planctomycetales bacterium]
MLLDTSGLLFLHHQAKPFHHETFRTYHAAPVRPTQGYVLAETEDATAGTRSHRLTTAGLVE